MTEFGDRISAAYASKGKTLDLGRGVVAGATNPSAVVQLSVTQLPDDVPDEILALGNRIQHVQALPIWTKYAVEIDRQSARELLDARVAQASAPVAPAPSAPLSMPSAPPSGSSDVPPRPGARKHQPAAPNAPKAPKGEDGAISGYLESREGRTMMNRVVRGVFDMLKK